MAGESAFDRADDSGAKSPESGRQLPKQGHPRDTSLGLNILLQPCLPSASLCHDKQSATSPVALELTSLD